MGHAFPELKKNPQAVAQEIRSEEEGFLRTIERGIALFEKAVKRAQEAGGPLTPTPLPLRQGERGRGEGGVISGKDIFDLYTTYGFPPDLTRQMAQENRLRLDEKGFQDLMRRHEEGSRQEIVQHVALNVSGGLPETDDRPKWSGPTAEGKIVGWIADNELVTAGVLSPGKEVGLLLDRTCFYAEQGGQVGDRGTISTATGRFDVSQTVKVGNAVVHLGEIADGRLEVGQSAKIQVDAEREFTRKNHTATHLLHWALRQVLGEHVEQRGSKVAPDEFTFDFAHTGPVTPAERAEIERLVNEKIYQDLAVQWRELPIKEAQKLPGVRAFFGDKYGESVRVVEVGDGFSREFCGGTHLDHTGQAGFFKITGEEGVGKGVRRLTCVTGREAVAVVQRQDAVLHELLARFRCRPEELVGRIDSLDEQIKKLERQLKKGASLDLQGATDRLLAEAPEVKGARLIVGEIPAGPEEQLRQQVDRLRQKAGSAVVVLGWAEDGKVGLLAAVTDDLVKKGVKAGDLVKAAAEVVGGKGGGRPNMAQAGGKDPAKLGEALALAQKLAAEQLAK
jgi:alanyl-tRNA synthetase